MCFHAVVARPKSVMYLYFEKLNAGTLYEKVQKEPTSVLFPAGFLLIYAVAMIWARFKDKITMQTPEVEPLLDNEPRAEHYYQIIVRVTINFTLPMCAPPRDRILCQILNTHGIVPQTTVYTGPITNAGTTSDVALRLVGTSGTTDAHILKTKSGTRQKDRSLLTCLDCIGHSNGLSRNSVRAYVLGTAKQIGDLTAIRIWHDCRGRSPDWFLHRITVENLATGEVYFFLCDKVSQSLWKFDLWRNRGVLCRGKLRPHTDVERDLSTD